VIRSIPTLAALLLACALPTSFAQTFPTKAVRVIVPNAAGGAPDIMARLASQHMTTLLGQPVVIENRAGAGGAAALLEVKNSPADGHTTMLADASHWAIFPAMQTVPYDFLRDFEAVSQVSLGHMYFVALTSFPPNSLPELIAYARANPGKLNYGTAGVGSIHHLIAAAFAADTHIDVKHIPYKGGAVMLPGLLAGDVQFAVSSIGPVAGQMKAGKVKLLAGAANKRFKGAPDVPTVTESTGLPNFEYGAVVGMVVRSGTPKDVINKLADALNKSLSQPAVVARAQEFGLDAMPTGPAELTELIRNEIRKYGRAVKISGAQAQ